MVVVALRTGADMPHLDWDDDRVLVTAMDVLAAEDRQARRAAGKDQPQMSG